MSKLSVNLQSGRGRIRGTLLSIGLALLALGALVGVGYLGYYIGTSGQSEWQERYVEFEREARQARALADSLQAESDRHLAYADSVAKEADAFSDSLAAMRQRSQQDRAEAERLYQEAMEAVEEDAEDQVERLVELVEVQRAEIQANLEEIDFLYQRDEQRQIEIQSLRVALASETERADTLQAVVDAIPEPPTERRVLGLFSISRRDAATVGLVIGILVGGIAL